MGKPTAMQEVRQLYCLYKRQQRDGKKIVYQHVWGTRQRRWRMLKEAERYSEYARLDKENGLLDVTGYQQEVQVINALRFTVLQCYKEISGEQKEETAEE